MEAKLIINGKEITLVAEQIEAFMRYIAIVL